MLSFLIPSNFRRTPVLAAILLAAAASASLPLRADEADDQYAVAAGHYARQRWKLAVDEFQTFLAKYPNHPKAGQGVFRLGEALLQAGRTAEAVKYFRLYLGREPAGDYARQAVFRLGETAYLAANYDAAQEDLDRFLEKYPNDQLNAYVLPYLGEIALARHDAPAAERRFRDGLQRFPQGRLQDDCRVGLGRALEKQNKHEEAERLYLAVAGKAGSPSAAEAQFRLGALQGAMGKYAQSIETLAAFENRFSESPWKPRARLHRGWALWHLGRWDEAQALLQGISADPKVGIQAQYWLALTEKSQGKFAAAVKTLLAAAQADPKHELIAAMRYHAGDALLKSGDAAGASRQFDEVIALGAAGSGWADHALRGKLQVALQEKDYDAIDRGAEDFEKRFAQSPVKADVHRVLATSLLERKNYAGAARLLEPLLAKAGKSPQSLEDSYLLALAYEGLKRYEEAVAALRPVLDAASGKLKADAQLRQGSLLVALKRYADAVGPLETVLAGNPTGDAAVKVRGELAVCCARTGQLPKAKKLYGELLAKYPKHPWITPTTEQLAEAAYEAHDTAWSTELFSRLRTESGTADYELKGMAGLGWSQFKSGQLAGAAATFEQLLKKDPPAAVAADAALARGRILEQLHQDDPALSMYDLVIEKHPQEPQHAEALLAAARLRHKLKQAQQSAALYERLAKDYPDFPKRDAVLYEWAWAMHELDKPEEAADLFARLPKEYPQSRFAPDATYRLAQRALAAKQYARAKELVSELLSGKTDARIREYARLLEGQIAVSEQKWGEVRRSFEALLKEFPESRQGLAAEFWIAESMYRSGEFAAAAERFEQLAQKAQGRRDAWLAMIPLRRAQVLAQRKKWEEAYAIAAKIEAEYPNFEQQYEVDYLIGRCLQTRAEIQAAREAFKKVIRSPAGAKTETAAMAQWMIGETYFLQKDYAAAVHEYLKVEILYAYPTWQAGALLQAGKCHELLGERKEAAQRYASVIKSYPDTSFAKQAAERLRGLSADEAGAERAN